MTEPVGKRGRHKDGAKRQDILDAAKRLFLERGVDVTTDEVVASAGVAKATLYANFSDKNELIEAVIQRESAAIISDGIVHEGLGFTERLELFGERYVRFGLDKNIAGWDRLIAHGARNDPTLPNRFFDAGPGRWQALLVQLLESPDARKELSIRDANQAAADLAGLWLGLVGLQVKLGAVVSLDPTDITQRVRHGIGVFRSHYGKTR